MNLSAMEDILITVELDSKAFDQVLTLAKEDKKNLQDEAACLLEKGLSICESIVTNRQNERKICPHILFESQAV